MKKIIVNALLLATFSIAMLVPDWKIQLAAQAGGCSPHELLSNPTSCYGSPSLNGTYKGSVISERISR
jgi:hypothetical protein